MACVYDFYRLNGFGVVDSAEALRLESDGLALLYARDMHHSGSVEVYAGRRRVGVLPPRPTDRYTVPTKSKGPQAALD